MKRLTALFLFALALACAVFAGPRAFAKLAWMAGYPGLALPFIRDEAARAAALYDLGRYEEADALFAKVGRSATYNRGLTLAATGRHALSVAYFDAVLFADRWDADARHNRAVVDALVPPVVDEAVGRGRIAATIQAAMAAEEIDPNDPQARWRARAERVRKPIDAKTVTADRAWLDTLADAPGEYLRNRLAAEQTRRIEAGEAAREEPSPW